MDNTVIVILTSGACPGERAAPPPPLQIEKQKKDHQSKF